MKALICISILLSPLLLAAKPGGNSSPILGQWITDKKNLIVEVYLQGSEYKGRIVWAADRTADPAKRLDEKNPVPALRCRKIVGLDVLRGLTYNPAAGCWENGHIYDATTGKTYSASVRLEGHETLLVRGYRGIELLGKTLRFTRHR